MAQNKLAFLRKYSMKELKDNLEMQLKHIRDTEKELAYLKSEVSEIRLQLRARRGEKKQFENESAKLLRGRKPKSSAARWELFKKIARRYHAKFQRGWSPRLFMDRMPDGRLSVKVGDGCEFPKHIESVLRSLADSFKVYQVTDSCYGDSHKGTRFYFNNIPGTSKYAPRKAA